MTANSDDHVPMDNAARAHCQRAGSSGTGSGAGFRSPDCG